MAHLATYAVLAFAAVAAAGPNLPPPIEVNAQIGRVHVPVTCTLFGSVNQTFEVVASGGLTAYGVSGGTYYLTDTAGNITLPDNVLHLARLSGASELSLNSSIYIDATNASPDRLLAYQGTQVIPVPAEGSTNLRFPAGNDTLPAVGPYTIGTGTDPSRLLIGDVEVTITLLNSTGGVLGSELSVYCPKPEVPVILGGVSLLDATQADGVLGSTINNVPANGYIPDFPTIPINNQYGFFRFPYGCDFGALGAQQLDLTIGGELPTVLIPGEQFNLTLAESFLRVPPSLLKLAKDGFGSLATFHTVVTSFDIGFTNASPANVNVASNPLISNVNVLNANVSEPLVIPIPEYNRLTIGPVTTADAIGNVVSVSAGNATATVSLLDSDGEVLYGFDVTCSPYASVELIGVSIAEQLPLNYSLGTVVPSA